jgi:plastocyanin
MRRRRDVIIGLSRQVLRRSRACLPRLRRATRRQMFLLLATPAILRAHRFVSRRIRQLSAERIIRAVWMAIEPLESRVMFIAIGTGSANLSDADMQSQFLASIYAAPASAAKAGASAPGVSGHSGRHASKKPPARIPDPKKTAEQSGGTQNVVLLDSNLEDSGELSQAILPGTKTFLYDSTKESAAAVLSQVVQWAQASDVRIGSLSILSHGHTGAFELGDQWISTSSLGQTSGEWRQLGHLFAGNASVDIFGCDVAAAGGDGNVLIDRIASLTGGAVFASDNLTGKGGDWNLEAGSRPQAAPADQSLGLSEPVLLGYDGTLATYTVTNTNDSGAGSLRQAILNANSDGGAGTIAFDIPGTGVHTIIPSSALPAVSDTVTINGITQPGYAGTPLIELDGASAGSGVDGLDLVAGNTTVRGLIVNRFSGDGIRISGAGGDIITGNYIGTDATGTASLDNAGSGVEVQTSDNTIGGTTSGAGNVISGNTGAGITTDSSTSGTLIQGNDIGTNAAGTAAVANGGDGIDLASADNTIGGSVSGAGNVISGNTGNGVSLNGASATGNVVAGNLIGLNAAGTAGIPNTIGLVLSGASSNTIGGLTTGSRNVISGNTSRGIEILGGASGNEVEGNYIGVDVTGSNPLNNDLGVLIVDSSGNTLGGIGSGGNVISGNTAGVDLFGSGSTGNLVEGNYIGTDAMGANAVPNQSGVIVVAGATSNTIGGLVAGAGNVISGNSSVGVYFNNGASTNLVEGNSIGINTSGAPLGNQTGVYVDGTSGAAVQGNIIGGTASGAGNVIADSQENGVDVVGSGASGTAILGNSISQNASLGVDLNDDGITANTGTENSSLANDGMNFPVFTSTSLTGSTLTVTGYVGSAANQSAFAGSRVEIFQADQNASGNGQGQTYLGDLTTNASGNFSGSLTISGLALGDYVTATATDTNGNTSEFGPNVNSANPPTVATPAAALPNPVTGLTTGLSVLGADDGGESSLTYTWAAINSPPAPVTFSDNDDNTAKNTTATFTEAGAYQFQTTITDGQGLSTTSNIVTVNVQQTFTSISIPSQPPAMADHTTYPYTATALDQFGNALATQPVITWSVDAGGIGGTISNTGLYSTPASGTGTDTIRATSGSETATAPVTVTTDGIFTGGADVGPPNVPGYFSYNAGAYSVTGGDNNNSATNDQFQFPDATYTGDTTLVAEVTSTSGTSSPASAGLIFRDSTASNSPFAGILLYPGNKLYFQARNVAGAGNSSAQASGSISAPIWLKLVRSGNTFSGYYSTNGTTWTQVGSSVTYSDPNSILGGLFVTSFNVHTLATATFTNVGQLSIATPAGASPSTVTGTTSNLSVLGTSTGGESNLTYTWSATGTPPAPVTLADNGDNSAKDTTATFTQPGVYNLLVTISDGANTVTSPVTVTVVPTLTSISVSPATPTINENGSQQFTALALDQFGNALSVQPSFNWGIANGGIGNVNTSGLYTAPLASGSAAVTANSGSVTGSATVTVTNAAPTVATAAAASPSSVTGTTTTLSVLGADDGGEPNLTYTWAATGEPAGADPLFSDTGDNSAKYSTVTFDKFGPYTFTCTISDGQGGTVNSSVNVNVEQTLTGITVSPANTDIDINGAQQFTAAGSDQFGNTMATPPTVAWTNSGAGSIGTSGIYTAPATGGSDTITATAGGFTGLATVTITDGVPTVATSASASPSPVTGKTTALSVLGADNGGESDLTYTWTTLGGSPTGVTFSDNTDNSAKDTTATFTQSGTYDFQVTITNPLGFFTTDTVTVIVDQTLTSIAVSPAGPDIDINGTQQFTAVGSDQFGNALSPQSTFTWTNSGAGSIGTSGIYTAPATGGSDTITATSGGLTDSVTATITDGVPTVAASASASPSPVPGTTTNLTVLGADDGGESDLIYAWSTINGSPTGVTFSDNSDNSAKDATATFTQSGTYDFQVTITNPLGLFTTSSVTVIVDQTLASISVSPANANIPEKSTQQFSAVGYDQFGAVMSTPPTFAWISSIGSIGGSSGVYTSPGTSGSATVTASSSGISGSQNITITNQAPTVAVVASATPSPVTGTTAMLSVLGADDGGEPNLTYTWVATAKPVGSDPQFSINGTNPAKDALVTFDEAGNYTFICEVSDGQGGTVSSSVNVTVDQTLSSITVTPASTSLHENGIQPFSAVGLDQFGLAMLVQPVFVWSNIGVGSIDSSGLFTASNSAGNATIFAASGAVAGSATVTVYNAPPTVALAASATPNPVTGTTTKLSVLGADDGGESNLTYKWVTTARPTNGFPTFSINGTNSAKDSTVTFDQAGNYTFACTISDGQGGVVTSSVDVTVVQALTSITVSASPAPGHKVLLTALEYDQFARKLTEQLPVDWSIDSGGGTISSTGLLVPAAQAGNVVVRATVGPVSGKVTVGSSYSTPLTVIPSSNPSSSLTVPGSDKGSTNLQSSGGTIAGNTIEVEPLPDLSPATSKDLTKWLQEKSSTVIVSQSTNKDATPAANPVRRAPDHTAPVVVAAVSPTTAPNDLKSLPDAPPLPAFVEIAPIDRTEILRELDQAQSDTWDQSAADEARLKLRVGLASAIGSTAASAYLLWLVRGGGVLASLLSSAPAWRLVDPLFVLPSRPFYRAMWGRRKKKEYDNPEDRFFGKNRRG